MPTLLRRSAAVLLLFALAACSQEKRSGESRAPANNLDAAAQPIASSAEASYGALSTPAGSHAPPNPTTAFTCDGGDKVQINGIGAAATLKDGRTVQLARDAAEAAHFRGEALEFRMKNGQGDLSQDERDTFHCTGR